MHMQRLKNFTCYMILLAVFIAINPIFGEEPVTRTETLSFNEVVLELPSNNLRALPVPESKKEYDKGKVRNVVIIIVMSVLLVGLGVAFAVET